MSIDVHFSGLGDGAGVAAAFQIVGHVSFAHVNPAVTVACVLYSNVYVLKIDQNYRLKRL